MHDARLCRDAKARRASQRGCEARDETIAPDVVERIHGQLLLHPAIVCQFVRTSKADAKADWRDLPDLLAASDMVSLHLPLAPDTERMIDAAAIASMKRGSVLVNTARGGLVDELWRRLRIRMHNDSHQLWK